MGEQDYQYRVMFQPLMGRPKPWGDSRPSPRSPHRESDWIDKSRVDTEVAAARLALLDEIEVWVERRAVGPWERYEAQDLS